MKKITLLIAITVIVSLYASVSFAGTIFVGMRESGAVRLDDSLSYKAYYVNDGGVRIFAISPDLQRLYCAAESAGKIAVIDAVTFGDIKDIAIPGEAADIKTNADLVYVLAAGELVVISDALQEITDEIYIGTSADKLVLSPSGKAAYVLSRAANKVVFVNLVTKEVEARVAVMESPSDITLTPDGLKLFVSGDAEAIIDVVNVEVAGVTDIIRTGIIPSSLAMSESNVKLYALEPASGRLLVIDMAEHTILNEIDLGITCKKLSISPSGAYLYVLNNGSTVPIIDTSSDKIVHTLQLDNPANDVFFDPYEKYAIVISGDDNKIYKVNHLNAFSIVSKMNIPGVKTVLAINADVGDPQSIYSDGSVIADLGEKGIFQVIVTAPVPGAIWSGYRDIFYWDPYINTGGLVTITCDENNIHYGTLPNNGYYHWNTAALGYNSSECVICVHVVYGTNWGAGYSGQFTVDNLPPVITNISPPDNGRTGNKRPGFHADVSDTIELDHAELRLDGVLKTTEQLYGQSDTVDFTPPSNLSYGMHTYQLKVWDTADNMFEVSTTFEIINAYPTVNYKDLLPRPTPIILP